MLEPSAVAELVRSANDGDQESWNRLVDTFAGLVWSVIRGYSLYGPEAADVSQTVWLRCVEHLGRIREPEHLAAWLATTARHECFRVMRTSGRSVPVEDVPEPLAPDPARAAEDPSAPLVREEDRAAVAAALTRIPARCQELLRMLAADPPPSYDEVTDVLGMPKGSIGPTRGRCLAHLRRALEEAGGLDEG